MSQRQYNSQHTPTAGYFPGVHLVHKSSGPCLLLPAAYTLLIQPDRLLGLPLPWTSGSRWPSSLCIHGSSSQRPAVPPQLLLGPPGGPQSSPGLLWVQGSGVIFGPLPLSAGAPGRCSLPRDPNSEGPRLTSAPGSSAKPPPHSHPSTSQNQGQRPAQPLPARKSRVLG